MISPKSLKFQIYNGFTVLLSLSSSIYYAYFAAFKKQHEFESDFYIELTTEILFFLEMLIMFLLEQTPRDSIYPIRDIG